MVSSKMCPGTGRKIQAIQFGWRWFSHRRNCWLSPWKALSIFEKDLWVWDEKTDFHCWSYSPVVVCWGSRIEGNWKGFQICILPTCPLQNISFGRRRQGLIPRRGMISKLFLTKLVDPDVNFRTIPVERLSYKK